MADERGLVVLDGAGEAPSSVRSTAACGSGFLLQQHGASKRTKADAKSPFST